MARTAAAALAPCLGLVLGLGGLANTLAAQADGSGPSDGSTPSGDRLIYTGASAPGFNTLSFANNVYSFSFEGDEALTWQIDLSDPKVAGGVLRIHELSSDSYPIDGGGPVFRDDTGAFSFPTTNYKKATLAGQSMSGGVLTLDYILSFNGSHPFRYEVSPQGKQLRVRCSDPTGNRSVANNFSGLAYLKSTGIENPVPIQMQGALAQPITMFRHVTATGTEHWFVANMFDQFQSNGSDYRIGPLISPVIGPDSTTFSLDTAMNYAPMSDGTLAAPLDDSFLIVVSSSIRDVLLDSTAPASPYHALLSDRMFFDASTDAWKDISATFDLYRWLGMYNLAGYFFFQWTSSAIDPPSQASVGPDWAPAIDQDNFEAMLNNGTDKGMLLGAYTAFDCLPPTAPASVNDPSEIVMDGAGVPKTYNGLGFPLLGVEASGNHAKAETANLKALGANAVYLDIQTYGSIPKGPDGGHLDQTATSPWSKTMRQGYTAQKGWLEDLRNTLVGPLLGEGSIGTVNANMEYLYYGYVDSVQRVINTGGSGDASTLPFGSPLAPTNFPIVPEYEWRVAAKNQVNHGNGFYHRFFGPSDGPNVVQSDGQPIYPLTQDALDLYLAFCISYGHAGFLITTGAQTGDEGYVTHPEAAQTYFMTNALQSLYFNSPISTIRYANQGQWKSFEQILFSSETLDSFRHVPLRLEFANGLRITVNNGPAPLTMLDGGQSYTLPAKTGWYASLGNGTFRAFSAIPPGTDGHRIDYCLAPSQYEYFNGRGQVGGYGGITAPAKRSAWRVVSGNLSVAEDSGGQLGVTLGPPPGLLSIQLTPANLVLPVGQRAGLKATANFDNGGLQDVTTVMLWFSTQPGIAKVNNAGVVTAIGSGTAKIVALDPTGALVSSLLTVSVP